jgi:hypothetical protein
MLEFSIVVFPSLTYNAPALTPAVFDDISD